MALKLNDRVKETSTTTGTGTLNLGGAVSGFETFVAGIGDGNTTYYSIAHRSEDEWETGLGTVTDASTDTLARTTVISSSNSDSAVDFSAGTKDVFCTLPASKVSFLDASNDLILGAGAAGVDYSLKFDGETSDGVITWMEDEDSFKVEDDLVMDSSKRLYLYDEGGEHISGDGTDLTIASGGDATIDAGDDIVLDADGANVTIKDGGTTTLDIVSNGITDVTLDAPGDIKIDADGGSIFFVDGGTTFGSAENTSGNLIIKSGTTTALTFSGANVTLAGDLTISGDDITMGTNTDTAIMVADGTNFNPVVPSGDVGLTNAGVFSIASGVIVNADVNASAAIADSKLATISTADKVSGAAIQIDGATDGTSITLADADKILVDDGGTTKYITASQLNTYTSTSISADDIGTGDAAVTLTTSSGNITIDAAANNTDIIFKGTDATSDITMLTLDGSEAGAATFNNKIVATELDISGNVDVDGTLEADAYTVDGTTLAEYIADTSGAMFTSNTETGITATYQDGDNTVDLAIDAAQTVITSIYATDLILGEDSQTAIDFGTANEIDFKADNAARLTLTSSALYPVTDNEIDLGTSSLEFKDAYFDGTVTSDAFAGPLTGDVTGNVSGTAATVTTAAQSNITSLGTLTTLTVDNVIINGSTIGHTGDTDLITVASGIATVAGEVSMTTLDIGGTNVTTTAAELNLIDGGTSRGTDALADGDGILINDGGTMKMTNVTTVKTYMQGTAASKGFAIALAVAL